MQRIPSSDGISVAVHDLGGDGPPLLLFHPTGFCGAIWRPVAAHLPEYHSLAPDLRGHGDSPAPPDHHFDWHGFADDVLAIVDALQLTGCVAAGHSKGGAALLLAEERRPGTFAALWCFEPIVFPTTGALSSAADRMEGGDNPMAAGARRRRATFPSREAARANFASKPPLSIFTPEALDAYLDGGFHERPDGSIELACPPEHEARVFEMGARHGGFDRLDEVQCPVTVVRGALDRYGPASFAAPIVERLPNGRLEVHDDLTHFGPQQAPEAMAESIRTAFRAI